MNEWVVATEAQNSLPAAGRLYGVPQDEDGSAGDRAPAESAVPAGKFLTFLLGAEEYGLEIAAVQEIIGLLPITRVPCSVRFLRGVINLRGMVVPVMDLRAAFGLPVVEPTPHTCIVVLDRHGVQVGVIVDRVCDVVDVATADITLPSLLGGVDPGYLRGVARHGSRVRLLLDIERVLAGRGAATTQSASGGTPWPGAGGAALQG